MKEIRAIAQLRIQQGKLQEFKLVAEECVQSVREKDKGTVQYDWFLNEDQTLCKVHEKYQDSEAVLEHMGNLGDTLGELLSLCDLSIEVFGSPSEDLLNALKGTDIKYYRPLLSL